MQFNFAFSTNEPAAKLWQTLGYEIVPRLPLAFRYPTRGFVDAFVMLRGCHRTGALATGDKKRLSMAVFITYAAGNRERI